MTRAALIEAPFLIKRGGRARMIQIPQRYPVYLVREALINLAGNSAVIFDNKVDQQVILPMYSEDPGMQQMLAGRILYMESDCPRLDKFMLAEWVEACHWVKSTIAWDSALPMSKKVKPGHWVGSLVAFVQVDIEGVQAPDDLAAEVNNRLHRIVS